MPKIVAATVDPARVEGTLRRTSRTALSRGGEIAAAAQARLIPAIADIDAALAARGPAVEAEAVAWTDVLTEQEKSNNLIGAIRDEMWNALGRPRRNRHLAQVFPNGVATYTEGSPSQRPVFTNVLQSRIAACASPLLKDDQRNTWIAQLEGARKALEQALDKHRPTAAPASVAEATYRSAVRLGHEQLRLFKRDLENLGLSSAQIFEIIPDGSPTPKAAKGPDPSPSADPGVAVTANASTRAA